MPKYYCNYCDIYLTHDSPTVRKSHNDGLKHKQAVREYYQSLEEAHMQTIIDMKLKEIEDKKRYMSMFPNSMMNYGMPPPPLMPHPPPPPPMQSQQQPMMPPNSMMPPGPMHPMIHHLHHLPPPQIPHPPQFSVVPPMRHNLAAATPPPLPPGALESMIHSNIGLIPNVPIKSEHE